MHLCPECHTRTMVRAVADGQLTFVCPCGYTMPGKGRDRLMKVGSAAGSGPSRTTSMTSRYQTLIRNAAWSRTMFRVAVDCSRCGLPYMTQIRLGPEELIILTCKCGHASRAVA